MAPCVLELSDEEASAVLDAFEEAITEWFALHESFPDDAEERGVLKLADIVGRVQQRLAAAAKSG